MLEQLNINDLPDLNLSQIAKLTSRNYRTLKKQLAGKAKSQSTQGVKYDLKFVYDLDPA